MAITLLLFNPYVDAVLVIALGICIGGIMNALTPYIEKIPWVGGAIANAVQGMSQAITHACGVILAPISDAVGGTFHAAARLIDWSYGEFRRHASLILNVVLLVTGLALAVAAIRALVHRLTVSHTGQAARIKTLEREYHGIERELKKLEHDVSKGIGADVLPRIKTLEREIGRVEHKTLPAIEAADAQAASAISDLWTWVHKNVLVSGTTAFAGAVAIALGALGLGGLRCPGFLKLLNNRGCGLGGLLDALLGLAISALALENVCTLLPILESAFGEIVGPVTHLLNEVPLGGCEQPPDWWAKLSVEVGPLPPQQTLGALPV